MGALNTFYIPEASISIIPLDPETGDPVIANAIYLGAGAKGLNIDEELEEIEDRPSGEQYPEVHHGAERHSISIERLWQVDVPLVDPPSDLVPQILEGNKLGIPVANARDYKLSPNEEFVLVIVWQDPDDPQRFMHRTYYGVTDRSHKLSSGSADDEVKSALSLRAKYYL